MIRRAIISVADKTAIIPFAAALVARGVTLISTGGSAGALTAAGLPVTEVATVTGSTPISGSGYQGRRVTATATGVVLNVQLLVASERLYVAGRTHVYGFVPSSKYRAYVRDVLHHRKPRKP